MKLRKVPSLTFIQDRSLAKGNRIESIIASFHDKDKKD